MPVDSLSAGTDGKPADVATGQVNVAADASKSNTGRLMFGAGVGGSIAPQPGGDNSSGVENDALLVASSDPEPESMRESKERYE